VELSDTLISQRDAVGISRDINAIRLQGCGWTCMIGSGATDRTCRSGAASRAVLCARDLVDKSPSSCRVSLGHLTGQTILVRQVVGSGSVGVASVVR
jgi:hypothetical protein